MPRRALEHVRDSHEARIAEGGPDEGEPHGEPVGEAGRHRHVRIA